MTTRELMAKLNEIENEYGEDFGVFVDAWYANLLPVEKVYTGSTWNIVIECE